MTYTWTNNPTQSGSSCNVDNLNDDLMHLKYDLHTAIQNHAKGQVIDSIYNLCSDPANIKGLWIFDQHGDSTTLTDRSTKGHNGILSSNGSALSPNYTGLCPYLNLTSNAYFEVADSDDFSFGNGSSDSPFSIVALINPNAVATNKCIMAKFNIVTGSTQQEYLFSFPTTGISFNLYDDSANSIIGRNYSGSLVGDIGSWHSYMTTYSGNSNVS